MRTTLDQIESDLKVIEMAFAESHVLLCVSCRDQNQYQSHWLPGPYEMLECLVCIYQIYSYKC